VYTFTDISIYTKIMFPGPQVQKQRKGGGGRRSSARIYVMSVRAGGGELEVGAGTGWRWMLVGN